MKHAVSISLGSSERDQIEEITLLGERICIERRGTDGDIHKATQLFTELDGKVEAPTRDALPDTRPHRHR